jgi:hypothetical protein
VIANAYHVLSIGGHRIDLVFSRSYDAASCTFYLHFIKPSRGRGKRMVISARESRLAEFLTLPRDVDLSSGIEAWTTEHKKSFFRQQSGQPVSSHANVHNHNNHHPIVQTDRSRSNYRQVNVDDWIRTNLDKNKLTPSTSIRGTEDRSKFAIADRLQQQFKSTEEKGEDSMGQSTQQEIVSGPGIYETRSHRLHSPQAARSANPNRNQPARDSEQSAQRGYDGPLRIQHTRVIPEPGSLNYNKPSYAATDLQSGQTFNPPAEAQKRAYFDRMNHFQELLAHSRQRGTQQHSVYRSETGSSVSSSTSSGVSVSGNMGSSNSGSNAIPTSQYSRPSSDYSTSSSTPPSSSSFFINPHSSFVSSEETGQTNQFNKIDVAALLAKRQAERRQSSMQSNQLPI